MSKKLYTILLVVFMIFNITAVAKAGNILYYVDSTIGEDQMLKALDYYAVAGIHTYTKLTNASQFATALANGDINGDYDLGIINIQNTSPELTSITAAINALGDFVNKNDGLSIYTDWSRNDDLASNFGVSWGGDYPEDPAYRNNPSMDITYAEFAAGIAGTVDFQNPLQDPTDPTTGHTNYNMSILGGTTAATYADGSTAIALGNDGKSITNGMLNDTFTIPGQGEQLYVNEIGYLLPPPAVPEPSTMLLFGTGLVGFFVRKRKT